MQALAGNEKELRNIVREYPYFAPARFLLAAVLQARQRPEAPVAVSQASLYFNNPLWLSYKLNKAVAETATEEPEQEITPASFDTPVDTGESDYDFEAGDDTDAPENADTSIPADSKLSSLLSDQLADFKKPVTEDAALEIDADKKKLHTIDYFASLGIKLDLNAIPQDRLTTQLRKFTDWLKDMKHPDAVAAAQASSAGIENERAAAQIAENSNESREVVTESMAEVLEKQGQTEKAIQLYIKLSFLNPEKSAYFAAKIQHLKGI